jgi:nucleoside-diphosphate-sugar epimerase
MQDILVTGAAGFIGSNVVKLLLENGRNVIGIDNYNDYYDINLKKHRTDSLIDNQNYKFIETDIEILSSLESIFESTNIDAVINLAARAGVRYSIINPYIYFTTNVNGSLNLLELMKKFNVTKYILASSSSLYAGEEMPFKENLPVNNPISQYATSKKAAEMLAANYYNLFGISSTVLRYFTVYGPAGRPDMSYFRFIKQIIDDKPITLYGDGTQARDFTYIDDIASGTIKALDLNGLETINLGGGNNPTTINRMIEIIEESLGKKANIEYKEFHKSDMKFTYADISKAKRLMDWQPYTGIEDGIKNTVNWFKENYNWLKDIKLTD